MLHALNIHLRVLLTEQLSFEHLLIKYLKKNLISLSQEIQQHFFLIEKGF